MVAEGLGRRLAPKARAEGALENVGLFGVRNRVKGPQFSGAARRNTETEQKGPQFSGATRRNHWRTENQ